MNYETIENLSEQDTVELYSEILEYGIDDKIGAAYCYGDCTCADGRSGTGYITPWPHSTPAWGTKYNAADSCLCTNTGNTGVCRTNNGYPGYKPCGSGNSKTSYWLCTTI